jgi:hypothetical protein
MKLKKKFQEESSQLIKFVVPGINFPGLLNIIYDKEKRYKKKNKDT